MKENKKTKVKICGITMESEIDCLAKNNADFAGFVLYHKKSKRYIENSVAKKLLDYVKEKGYKLETVAVVVSPDQRQMEEISEMGFDYIQIHGNVEYELLDISIKPVWLAINISDKNVVRQYEKIINHEKVAGVLIDGENPGSGKKFPWHKIKDFNEIKKCVIMAGGLTAENVAEAIERYNPDIVDVSSGVEYDDKTKTGKDETKVADFIKKVYL